jgi:nicotinate-nucleotide adenylyltransferase
LSGLPGRHGDARRRRIGLLGGSFNPAHHGHAHVARVALHALGLDEVWLMVSPGNPLKPAKGMAPFAERLASAREVADGVRIIATDIEQKLGSRYTYRTLALLRQRFRWARFVLILGADNLIQLPRWRRWQEMLRQTPLAVLPRPGYSRAALHGQAASVMRHRRRRAASLLKSRWTAGAPWCFVPAAERAISATQIRAARGV